MLLALRRFLGPAPAAAPAVSAPPAATEGRGSRRGGGGGGGGGGAGSFEDAVLFLVFSSNFAGIFASRTIHYQFYSW